MRATGLVAEGDWFKVKCVSRQEFVIGGYRLETSGRPNLGTRDRRVRHPSFKGMREDKPARVVKRELPKA